MSVKINQLPSTSIPDRATWLGIVSDPTGLAYSVALEGIGGNIYNMSAGLESDRTVTLGSYYLRFNHINGYNNILSDGRSNFYSTGPFGSVVTGTRDNYFTVKNEQTTSPSQGWMAQFTNSYIGAFVPTIWGATTTYPRHMAMLVENKLMWNNGTYTLNANADQQNANAIFQYGFGSADNNTGTTLNITCGTDPTSGYVNIFARMNGYTGPDNGNNVEVYNGWITQFVSLISACGAAGSSVANHVHYAVAGTARAGTNVTITNSYGFYMPSVKQSWITNSWAFYQSGASDNNYFAGKLLVGTSTTSTYIFEVNGTSRMQGQVSISSGTANDGIRLVSSPSTNEGGTINMYTLGNTKYVGVSFYNSINGLAGSFQYADTGVTEVALRDAFLLGPRTVSGKLIFVRGAAATQSVTMFSSGSMLIQDGGTHTEITSSIFQLSSTTKGFLPPKMTTTQKNAIASPVAGLVVYDTTLNKLCVYTTAWQTITSA